MVPSDLYLQVAQAKTDAQLERALRELDPDGDLEKWREERDALAYAVGVLEQARRMPPASDPGPKPLTYDKRILGAWMRAASEARDQIQIRRVLAARVNAALRRTVAVQLRSDLSAVEPASRSVLGECWLQLAEAARGFAAGRTAQDCAHCGAAFVPKRAPGKRAPVRFCSPKCRQASFYANR